MRLQIETPSIQSTPNQVSKIYLFVSTPIPTSSRPYTPRWDPNYSFTKALQQHSKYAHDGILLITLLVILLLAALVLRLVRSLVALLWSVRLWVLLVLATTTTVTTVARRHDRWAALEVDVHAASIGLRHVLQAELLADLLDAGFDLLDVVGGVVTLADDARGRARC